MQKCQFPPLASLFDSVLMRKALVVVASKNDAQRYRSSSA